MTHHPPNVAASINERKRFIPPQQGESLLSTEVTGPDEK